MTFSYVAAESFVCSAAYMANNTASVIVGNDAIWGYWIYSPAAAKIIVTTLASAVRVYLSIDALAAF